MKNTLALLLASSIISVANAANFNVNDAKYKEDKATILQMAGCYTVQFKFSETFAPDTAYKYHNKKFESAQELVIPIANSDSLISFQHLLIVGEGMVVKHWRQDWIYQNQHLYNYEGDNIWESHNYTPEQVKGTWTQKVYNVDDMPRYEGKGTWVHVDGRHFWESTTDAPLPRREYTTRNDYNVLTRHSHVEVTDSSWVLDQDNEKVIRKDGKSQLLCMEKGIEAFTKDAKISNCADGQNYWDATADFWKDVRSAWVDIFATHPTLKTKNKVDGKSLYIRLFDIAEKVEKDKKYNHKETYPEIKKAINLYVD